MAATSHDLRPAAPLGVPGMRELTPGEVQHLDRLRAYLAASRADVRDPAALDALLSSARRRASLADRDRDAMLAALGVGIGDAVLARAPGARWVLRTSGIAPVPALLDATGALAVVPLDDVQRRWVSGEPGWVPGYVVSAARRLGAPEPAPAGASRGDATASSAASSSATSFSAATASTTPAAPPGGSTSTPPVTGSTASVVPAPRVPAPAEAAARPARPRTPADLDPPPSQDAQGLALDALDLALGRLLAGGATSPFALVEDSRRRMRRFDDDPGATVADARAWVAASAAARAAVGWCGRLDDDGRQVATGGTRAVLVAASDAGLPGLVVAHRFVVDADADPGDPADSRDPTDADGAGAAGARPVGEIVLVGACPPVLEQHP